MSKERERERGKIQVEQVRGGEGEKERAQCKNQPSVCTFCKEEKKGRRSFKKGIIFLMK